MVFQDKPLSLLVQRANGELAIEGYFGDVYYELVEQLNATAMVIYAPENVTGYDIIYLPNRDK